MSVETLGNWGDAIRGVGVQFAEFKSQFEGEYSPSWEPVVKTMPANGAARITTSGLTGVGLPTRFTDGSTVPKKNRYKLYDTEFNIDHYGAQISVSRFTILTREFQEKFDEFKALAYGARVLKSKAPAQIFNRMFTSGNGVTNGVHVTTYGDAKPLASVSHPRVDGGSAQSNASSTGITLTESNFETARLALMNQLNDDGTPIEITGSIHLVVPDDLEKTATIITGSTQRSGTANNDLNFYSGGSYPVLSSKWLNATHGGSATQWALVALSTSGTPLRMYMFGDLALDMSVDKNTKSAIFDVILDFEVGSVDWRGFWATKGDGQAYSD